MPGVPDLEEIKKADQQPNTEVVVFFVIMLTIFTVVFSYLMYNWAETFVRPNKQTPTVGMVQYRSQNGDFIVEVEKVDPDAVSVISVNYILLDTRSSAVPGVQGSVKDIYCIDYYYEPSGRPEGWVFNVSFIDTDLDAKLSAGDYFVVRHVDNRGQAEEGYILLLKSEVTGDKMNGGGTMFRIDEVKEVDPPTSTITTTAIDSENFSLNLERSILSRFWYLDGMHVSFNFSFTYLGSEERDLSIPIREDGYLVNEETIHVNATHNISTTRAEFRTEMISRTEGMETHTLTFEVRDEDSNHTMFAGHCDFTVKKVPKGSPSFAHPPSLQIVSLCMVFTLAFWNPRKPLQGYHRLTSWRVSS